MCLILQKKIGWETFWDSVKFTWDSTFVDALGPRDAIEIKPKSNTGHHSTNLILDHCAHVQKEGQKHPMSLYKIHVVL